MRLFKVLALVVCIPLAASATTEEESIVPCGGSFDEFVNSLKAEAIRRGQSRQLVDEFFGTVQHDPDVIRRDRNQGIFKKSFMEFSKLVMTEHRLVKGQEFEEKYGQELDNVYQTFGVPRGVLLSFLALETDYGVVQGDFNTLDSLVTLSHDCRRPALFQPHVFAALLLYESGNFDPVSTIGAWAGEVGMIQMLPQDILFYGVDHDQDGKIDLKSSVADALMTAGNVLSVFGWQPGEPWLVEIKVPSDLDWSRTGPDKSRPIREWQQEGVQTRSGTWPSMEQEAAVLLPHGRKGPAFFAFPNYKIYLEWNKSFVYTTTSAYFATLLSGAPMYLDGDPPPQLPDEELQRLQRILAERGHDVGKIDGIIGAKTRAAVQAEQIRLGLPADSWPTLELLALLQ